MICTKIYDIIYEVHWSTMQYWWNLIDFLGNSKFHSQMLLFDAVCCQMLPAYSILWVAPRLAENGWWTNNFEGANKSAARISGSADQERKHRRSHGVPNVRNLRCLWIDITSTDVYKAHVIICLEGLTYKSEQTMKNWVTWHSSRFAEWFKSTLWAPQLLHSHCPEVNEICSENPHMNLS